MPAGTWNLGRLRKRADYVGLKDLGISIIDRTVNSDNYFNITEFPNQLTGGKNLFKLKASANTLVKDSKIHIEVLDSNGNPLYYEPINYLEADGTRVIAIYVYPDSPYGIATVYVAGRARVDQNGNALRVSQNVNDPDYINFPNVIWSRTVTCAPERLNSTEIIFTKKPQLTLQEVVQPYLQPVNLTNVATQSFGIGTCTIRPKPGSVSTTKTLFAGLSNPSVGVAQSVQGSNTAKSPPSYLGTQIQAAPASLAIAAGGGKNNTVSISPTLGPVSATTTTLITALDESIFETSVPFFTGDMGPGDVITIVNPQIEVPGLGAELGSGGLLLPASQTAEGFASAAPNVIFPLSGSYHFVIDNVLNTKKAQVVLLDSPAGFKNLSDSNTGGKWSVSLKAGKGTQTVDRVKPTANYTCSFTLPYVLQMTDQSQSFAEIKISDIEPATGDVYKLKTFYKAGGQFGDFVDAGETVLEQVELLEDPYEYEGTAIDGTTYNRMGFFSSLEDYHVYFTSSQGILPPTIGVTESFEPDDLLSGIRLTPDSNYGPDDFSYIKLKEEYTSSLSLTRDTSYLMTVNLFGDNSYTSTDPNVSLYPQLDIYVSGSQGSIYNDEMTVNAYIKQPFATQTTPVYRAGYEESLNGIFASPGPFGTRVGSIQVTDSGSIVPAIFRFQSLKDQEVDLYIVQRNGRFNLGNLSIKTFNESKFTPNFTKINTRIPTQFLKTPLTFKIQFYDYLNNQADADAIIYPITFTGENLVVGGTNNLFTGSIYIGNTVGSGIELAGVNSGYIRSIGYEGFKSASRTDRPGGFMIYTGSVLPAASDNYNGTGLEIVEHSESFLRFSTGTDPGIEIRTPKFFLGSRASGNFISGSNGNLEITSSNFHLDRDGDVVMQGTITAEAGGSIGGFLIQSSSLSTTAFAISSSQNANDPASFISSSNFKVSAGGSITGSSVLLGSKGSGNYLEFDDDTLTVQGNITVDNIRTPATIGGSPSTTANASSSINSDGFARFASASIAGFEIIDSEIKSTSEQLRLKSSGQITGSQVLFDGGKIAGWTLSSKTFSSIDNDGGINIDSNAKLISILSGSTVSTTNLKIGQIGTNKFGISGKDTSGNEIFKLGEDGNEIAGWTITDTTLAGGQMIINKNGTIESAGFASNVAGSGFRLTADQGGFLEVENARIRGTLSTAVFEKEAVNAVGGQLYVANSSVLTGSAVAPNGVHTATTTTMSLENVSGFASGEILTAKKVSETGFATEYLLVNSASRFDKASDTNFAGYIYVTRGYSGSAGTNHDSGSLGDLASNAQSYSGSQVIVSTGKIGTGYIRLNANPNDPYTPYIDIVERTGSAIYDIDLKARLGDLSGLSQARLHGTDPANAGFGLYSQNVFLEGGIVARTGSIAGIEMEDSKLYTGDGAHADANTGFYIDSGSNFSLGDKLTWDGNSLTVRGQIQLTDGTDISSGTDGAPARTLTLSTNANAMVFDDSSDTSATPTEIIFSISQQNLATPITGSDITITDANDDPITGFSYTTGSVSGSESAQLFSGIGSGSLSFTATTTDGGLNSNKLLFPVTISVTSGSTGASTILSDSTTVFKVEGGVQGNPGTPGTSPALITLNTSTLTFVKALDGTITPATASITASLQNMSPATASYTTTPSITLNTGSLLDLTRMELTKDNFGANTSVQITAFSGSNHQDTVTFVLLDEGSGNIQTTLSNPSHTFPANSVGDVTSFSGGGTTLRVFEGATALTLRTNTPTSGQYSASISAVNVTPGSVTGNATTTTTISDPTAISAASGALHYTVTGFTQNNTAFTSSVTQSFARSDAGASGSDGSPGDPGAPGTDAKSLSLESSTFTFFKAQDGTITPATASITASMQNLSSATASYTIVPSVTLNTGSLLDLSRMELTKDNFGTNSSVRITATGDGGAVSDSINFVLIDEGSGNVQTILTNQAHTFQADHTGSISDFSGGGTGIEVFEGASKLKHTSIDITSATNISGYYPQGVGSSAAIIFQAQNNAGTNYGVTFESVDGTTRRYIPTGSTANGTDLTGIGSFQAGDIAVTQASSGADKAANMAAAITSSNGHTLSRLSCSISTTNLTGDTLNIHQVTIGPDGDTTITAESAFAAGGHLAEGPPGKFTNGRPIDQHFANGWFSASISTQNITPGLITDHRDYYNQIQATSGAKGRYCFSTEAFEDGTNTNQTLSPQIIEDFSTAVTLTAHRNTVPDGVTSVLWPNLAVGDRLVYWISPSRWYEYEIQNVNSGNNTGGVIANRYNFELTFITENVTVPEYRIHKSEELDVYFIHKPRQIALSAPTAMSAASGEIHLTITGSTLNGTAFEQFVTQSFVRSDAGNQPITAQSSRPAITLPGDTNGDPTSFVGSGTTISVFEGASQLQGIDDAGTPANGQFEVARSGDNITPGADSVDGLNIAIADHSSATETSGSITYTITGKSVGGDSFTRTLTQPFSVTTQGADGAPGDTGATGPTFDFLTSSFAEVDTSTAIGAGLLMTDEVFGFHNGIAQSATPTLADFTSFLDSNGNFYLGGNASGISASGDFGYFAWNNSDRSLLISGSAVDIKVDKFYLGRTGQYISGSGGNIEIKSSTFHLERDGDLNMQGNVTASGIMINGEAKIEGAVTASGILINGDSKFQGEVTVTNATDFADPNAAGPNFPTENLIAYYPLDRVHTNDANGDNVSMILDEAYNTNRAQTTGTINSATAPYHSDNVTSGDPVLTTNGFTAGGPGDFAPGSPLDSAMRFDGTDDRVKINSMAGAIYHNMDISVSFWMFHSGGLDECVFHLADGGQNDFNVFMNGGSTNNKIRIHVATTAYDFTPTKELTNAWTHIAITLQNGASNTSILKLYIDGILVNTATSVKDTSAFGDIDEALIGLDLDTSGGFGSPGNFFEGALGQLRFYDMVLSQANVTSLYHNANGQNPEKHISFKDDFGGQSGLLIGTSAVDSNTWQGYGNTAGIEQVNGRFQMKTATAAWNTGVKSRKTFTRKDCDTLVFDITITDVQSASPFEPRMMVGWGDVETLESHASYKSNAGAFYFTNNDIRFYEGNEHQQFLLTDGVANDDKFRCELTPNKNSGFHGRIYKFPDLDTAVAIWNTHGDAEANTTTKLDIGVWAHITTNTFYIDQMYVESNGAGAATTIKGDSISTGIIQSNNFSSTSGSQMDLDLGTITMGGSANPGFEVDADGFVKATNFSERLIKVDATNKTQYYENYSSGGNRTRLIFDGTLGGTITMNLQMSVAPDYPIGDVKLPTQATSDYTTVRIICDVAGIEFDDGIVAGGMSNMSKGAAIP